MLTCIAEGRGADEEEERGLGRGPAVVCKLSLDHVHAAVTLSDKQSEAIEGNYVSKLVVETARRAVELAKMVAQQESSKVVPRGDIWSRHMEVPPPPKTGDEVIAQAGASVTGCIG